MNDALVMIMAGGKGSRLGPLTVHRAKPASPFGGRYRIIDFVLSNFTNSGYRHIYVLTQYMAGSLIRHLNRNWHQSGAGEFIEVSPAQMRKGDHWYLGTADSVYQNLNLILDSRAPHVAVFGGDHIYKFDVKKMEQLHRTEKADLTVAAFPVPIEDAHQFGVIQTNAKGEITGFQEKPAQPTPMPGDPTKALVSMGNYFFETQALIHFLREDATTETSTHDFGRDLIPRMVADGRKVIIYNFGDHVVPGDPDYAKPYWRDVGTIDSYFQANMELRSPLPNLNMYNREWRIRTAQRDYPPARFVRHHGGQPVDIDDCLICEGSIVQSATLRQVVLGYDCFVHAGAHVERSMLGSGCDIGENSILRGVLADKNCSVARGTEIGVNPNEDRKRFPIITEQGIVVLPKGTRVPKSGPLELARDMFELMEKDPGMSKMLRQLAIKPVAAGHLRHSYPSRGPQAHAPRTMTKGFVDE